MLIRKEIPLCRLKINHASQFDNAFILGSPIYMIANNYICWYVKAYYRPYSCYGVDKTEHIIAHSYNLAAGRPEHGMVAQSCLGASRLEIHIQIALCM